MCFLDRFSKEKVHVAITIKKIVLFPAYSLMTFIGLAYLIYHSFRNSNNGVSLCNNWQDCFGMIIQYVTWYMCSNALVVFLKIWIADHTCNKHPNSVSGHYNFVLFSLLSMIVMSGLTGWRNKGFKIFYTVYLLLGFFVMLDTLFFGYHSLRYVWNMCK